VSGKIKPGQGSRNNHPIFLQPCPTFDHDGSKLGTKTQLPPLSYGLLRKAYGTLGGDRKECSKLFPEIEGNVTTKTKGRMISCSQGYVESPFQGSGCSKHKNQILFENKCSG
jgi:hypothetical protein